MASFADPFGASSENDTNCQEMNRPSGIAYTPTRQGECSLNVCFCQRVGGFHETSLTSGSTCDSMLRGAGGLAWSLAPLIDTMRFNIDRIAGQG